MALFLCIHAMTQKMKNTPMNRLHILRTIGVLIGLSSISPVQAFAQPAPTNNAIVDSIKFAYQAENYAKVISDGESALQTDPQLYDLYPLLGNAYLITKQPQKAIPYLQKADEQGIASSSAKLGLCYAYNETNSPNAVETCTTAASLYGDYPDTLFDIAKILKKFGQNDAARALFRKAYDKAPQNTKFLTTLTTNLTEIGDYQTAYELTEKAIHEEEKPQNAQILYHNAAIYAQRAKLSQKAIELCDKAIEDFHDSSFLVTKAFALFDLGKFQDANDVIDAMQSLQLGSANASRIALITAKTRLALGDPSSYALFEKLKNDATANRDFQFKWMIGFSALLAQNFDEAESHFLRMTTFNALEYKQIANFALAIIPIEIAKTQINSADDETLWKQLPKETKAKAIAHFKMALSLSPQKIDGKTMIDAYAKQGVPEIYRQTATLIDAHQNEDYSPKSSFCSATTRHQPTACTPLFLLLFFALFAARKIAWVKIASQANFASRHTQNRP